MADVTPSGAQSKLDPELVQAVLEAYHKLYVNGPPTIASQYDPKAPKPDWLAPSVDTAKSKKSRSTSPKTKPPGDQRMEEIAERLIATATLAARSTKSFLRSYCTLFHRLKMSAQDVGHYLRAERRTLARLYFEIRVPRPSPTRVRQLAFQLALDARDPIPQRLAQFEYSTSQDGLAEIRVHSSPAFKLAGLPARDVVRAFSPAAEKILPLVFQETRDFVGLIDAIERYFGREVTDDDATDELTDKVVGFSHSDGVIRLWVNDTEVVGLQAEGIQRLLAVFCPSPEKLFTSDEVDEQSRKKQAGLKIESLSKRPRGRSMAQAERKSKHSFNVSKAAGKFNLALRRVLKALGKPIVGNGNWFTTGTRYGWADGVIVRPHPRNL